MDKRQKLLAKACEIALRHPDLHPFHVAVLATNAVDGETDDFDAFLIGLLHDSLEDEYSTFEELSVFPDDISYAVAILTRGDGEDYWSYIARIKTVNNPLAIRVKVADALVNLNRCRGNFGYGSLAKRYERVIKELS